MSEGAGVYGAFHLGARRAGQAPISLTPAWQVGLRLRVQDAESQAGRRAAVSAGRGGRVSHPRSRPQSRGASRAHAECGSQGQGVMP